MSTITSVAGWIYPGSTLVNGQSTAPTEYSSGRQLAVLKPQYYTLQSNGVLVQNTVDNSGIDGYTAANAAQVKTYSVTQFVTISGGSPGMNVLAGSNTLLTNFNNTLVAFLQSTGLTGIELDFEEPPWTVAHFTDMKTITSSLGTALHANGFKLMITGPALFGPSAWDWSAFNSLPVDYVCPQCYDHFYDTNGAGDPAAPLAWLTSCCNWMLSQVSNPLWIVMGLNNHGYHGATGGYAVTYDDYVQSQALPGFSTAVRDASSGELQWTIGSTSYNYSDSTTLNGKVATVAATGITQISIWHLGGNNQWPTVQLTPPASSPTINGSVQTSDTFGNRTAAPGLTFGTSSSGATWNTLVSGGGTATTLAINALEGIAFYDNSGAGSGYAETVLSTAMPADTEVLCRFAALSNAGGHFGLFARYTANSQWYRCDININGNTISLAKTVGGVYTSGLASASITIVDLSYYWVRFRTQGNTVEAKVWADGTAEPGGWTVSVTDTSLTTTQGQVGMMLVPITTAPGGGIAVDSFTASALGGSTIALSATFANVSKFLPSLIVGATLSQGLYTVLTGATMQAQDINQLINVLQRSAGSIEIGTYFLEMPAYAALALISCYIPTLSRGTSPLSITVDTSTQAPVSMGSPNASKLSWAGFQLSNSATSAGGNVRCGGKWTVQY